MPSLDERLDPQVLSALQEMRTTDEKEMFPPPNPAVVREDFTIPGPENASDVLVHMLQRVDRGGAPTSALLWIPGGGFIGRDLSLSQKMLENIVLETAAVVVIVEYRLAPAHPFPAAPNDCYAALQWLASVSDEYHIDRDRIVIGGGSAGVCLAAAVTLMARDKGGPSLCYQFLLNPITDDRLLTPSSQEITDSRVFNSAAIRACWEAYLGENDSEVSPYAAPARATDLSGLPPAYVYVEDQDPMRDEGIAYANRLMQAGVFTELHVVPGTYHGSFMFAPEANVSKRAVAEHMSTVKRILNPK